MDDVEWNKKARSTVRNFPSEAKKEIGHLLLALQAGVELGMPFSRPMRSLGKGCRELRVKEERGVFRVFYYLKIKNKIIVFHAFKKKTEKTPKKEIEIGRKNLKEMLNEKR